MEVIKEGYTPKIEVTILTKPVHDGKGLTAALKLLGESCCPGDGGCEI